MKPETVELKKWDQFLYESQNLSSINLIFQDYPELSSFGTVEDYSRYLSSIFPNSKLKDIVYHGGTLDPGDRGKDPFTGEFGGKYGIYFTGSKSRAKKYISASSDKTYKERSMIYSAILDIKNPLDKKIWGRWKFGLDRIGDKEFSIIKQNNSDGLIEKGFIPRITQYNSQYVVFNLDQIHILGSEEDISGFKIFMNK